jgi:hypothetical protein
MKELNTVVEDIYSTLKPLSQNEAIPIDPKLLDDLGESLKRT